MIKTGSVVLAANPVGFPKISDSFTLGSQVRIICDGIPLQVLGNIYVEHGAYDEREEYITLTCSCLLGIKNNSAPGDLGVCVNLDVGVNAGTVTRSLLSRVNIPVTIPFSGSRIREPVVLGPGESLVRKAGEICFANGYFLYEDAEGIVRARSYDLSGNTMLALSKRDLVRANKNYDGDIPPSVVTVDTGVIDYAEDEENYSLRDNTPTGFIDTVYTIDREARTITTEQYEYSDRSAIPEDILGDQIVFGVVLIRESFNVEQYEAKTNGFNPSASTWGNCIPLDEGRLLSREQWTNEIKGIALAEYYRIALAVDPAYTPSLTELVEKERTRQTFTYDVEPESLPIRINAGSNSSSIKSDQSISNTVTCTTLKFAPEGILMPFTGDPKLGRPESTTTYAGNPSAPVQIYYEKQTWQRAKTKRNWSYISKSYESEVISNPQGINTAAQNPEVSISNVISAATRLKYIKTDRERQTPSYQRFPIKLAPVVKPIQYYANFGLSPVKKRLSYSVDPLYSTPEAARRLVKQMGAIAWGRYGGWLIAGKARDVSPIGPLSNIRVDNMVLAADSLSVTLNSREYFYGFRGILSTTTGNSPFIDGLSFDEQLTISEATPVVIYGLGTPQDELICL